MRRLRAVEIADAAEHIELFTRPEFEQVFAEAMGFV